MDAEKLYESIGRRPFEPVRIHLCDGSHYDIRHPDQIMVARRWCYVGIGGDGNGPFQDTAVIANMHVTRIDLLKKG